MSKSPNHSHGVEVSGLPQRSRTSLFTISCKSQQLHGQFLMLLNKLISFSLSSLSLIRLLVIHFCILSIVRCHCCVDFSLLFSTLLQCYFLIPGDHSCILGTYSRFTSLRDMALISLSSEYTPSCFIMKNLLRMIPIFRCIVWE